VQFVAHNQQHVKLNLDGALGVFDTEARASCFQRMRRLLDTDRRLRVKMGLGSLCILLAAAAWTLPHIRAANNVETGQVVAEETEGAAEDGKAPPSGPDAAYTGPTFELFIRGPDGQPVPQCEVEVRSRPQVTERQVQRGEYLRQGNYGIFLRTDADGGLRLELPENLDSFDVAIRQPGFGPYWAAWNSEENSEAVPSRFVANLDAGRSVGGVVVDEEGRPIEGALVHPSIQFKKRDGDFSSLGVGTQLKTDPEGKWVFHSVPASMEQLSVEVSHPEFMPLWTRISTQAAAIQDGAAPAASIVMQRGITVTGRVTDEVGEPIPGAVLRARFLNDRREATTGEDGTYRLVGCRPDQTSLVATAAGRAPDLKELRIEQDMPAVDFQLEPGRTIRVRVVDPTGNPIPRTRIFFKSWRKGSYGYNPRDYELGKILEYTDQNGVWEWHEAPADTVVCSIYAPDHMEIPDQTLLARDEEYVFTPPPALEISGRVIDAETKEPVKTFRVVPGVRSSAEHMNWVRGESYDAQDGSYRIKRTHAYMAWIVRIEADGYRAAVSRDVKSDEGEVRADFELTKAPDIAATVLTPQGLPAAGARIALGVAGSQISVQNGEIDDGSTLAGRRNADEEGSFRFPSQGDACQLVITHSSGFAHVKSAGQDLPDVITLTPWARVKGTFRVGPRTVANVRITLNVDSVHSYGEDVPNIFTHHDVTTGADGEFVFERVFPGRGRIGRGLLLIVGEGAREVTSSQMEAVLLTAGESVDIDLGGFGHAVTGQLVPPAGHTEKVLWNFALVNVAADVPKPVRTVTPYFTATVDRDGRFRIDDMPPGDYVLIVRFSEHSAGHLSHRAFSVPELDDNQARRELDLGILTLEPN
jgi:protocatechuate 3,4-dioxygenase beta subunit